MNKKELSAPDFKAEDQPEPGAGKLQQSVIRELFSRIHAYVMNGIRPEEEDQHRVFTVSLNKEVRLDLSEYNPATKVDDPKVALYPKKTVLTIGLIVLMRLVQKAIQEGSDGMRFDYYATGKSLESRPLIIELLSIQDSNIGPNARKRYFIDPKQLPSLLTV